MRQLIPRLLRRLNEKSAAGETIRPLRPPAKGAKSLRRSLPPPPVLSGRSRSILLDDINPITTPKLYRRHKSLPPQVRLPDSHKARTVSRDGTVEDDVRREMTAEEREWFANPYRMLHSFTSLSVRPATNCRSSDAINADTQMFSVLAVPPQRHVAFVQAPTMPTDPTRPH